MIDRSHYGPFGVAVSKDRQGSGYTAWACRGDTVAQNAIFEPAHDVWFEIGGTAQEALDRLKNELKTLLN